MTHQAPAGAYPAGGFLRPLRSNSDEESFCKRGRWSKPSLGGNRCRAGHHRRLRSWSSSAACRPASTGARKVRAPDSSRSTSGSSSCCRAWSTCSPPSWTSRSDKLFAEWGQLGRVLSVIVPTAVFVALIPSARYLRLVGDADRALHEVAWKIQLARSSPPFRSACRSQFFWCSKSGSSCRCRRGRWRRCSDFDRRWG